MFSSLFKSCLSVQKRMIDVVDAELFFDNFIKNVTKGKSVFHSGCTCN